MLSLYLHRKPNLMPSDIKPNALIAMGELCLMTQIDRRAAHMCVSASNNSDVVQNHQPHRPNGVVLWTVTNNWINGLTHSHSNSNITHMAMWLINSRPTASIGENDNSSINGSSFDSKFEEYGGYSFDLQGSDEAELGFVDEDDLTPVQQYHPCASGRRGKRKIPL